MDAKPTGTLYIVSGPIGNLADVTFRAVEILKSVHLIAAEDTRHTKKLLNHYQISTPLVSYHSYNQMKQGPRLIEKLQAGNDVALISDAGTPGISDPLFQLAREAVEASIPIYPAPGPSAVLAALAVSGLPSGKFVFEGFLPRKKGRQTRLKELAEEKRTLVFFESPHRIQKTLADLFEAFGERQVALARELTKLYEEVVRAPLSELAGQTDKTWKGEITLVVAGNQTKPSRTKEN